MGNRTKQVNVMVDEEVYEWLQQQAIQRDKWPTVSSAAYQIFFDAFKRDSDNGKRDSDNEAA